MISDRDRRRAGTIAGRRGLVRGTVLVAALLLAAVVTASFAAPQFPGWWGRGRVHLRRPPERPVDRHFSFCRVLYDSVRREYLGQGWRTDYPDADSNLMTRLNELTTTAISRDLDGDPNHVVVELTDPRLFQYPFIFMSDVGTIGLSEIEAALLREYLLKGGFLWVDDFWGPRAWEHWTTQLATVLPPGVYPIVDVPIDHPILTGLFAVRDVPQIPSINFWRGSGGQTSERGPASAEPHFRGIADANGRLMVFMSHNTDIADGWEREGQDPRFFHHFSVDAYAVGINVVLYAMSR